MLHKAVYISQAINILFLYVPMNYVTVIKYISQAINMHVAFASVCTEEL